MNQSLLAMIPRLRSMIDGWGEAGIVAIDYQIKSITIRYLACPRDSCATVIAILCYRDTI